MPCQLFLSQIYFLALFDLLDQFNLANCHVMHIIAMLECIHAHHYFCIAKLFIMYLCVLVDAPEFYEEACDCPHCVPSCCQGKWHMKYLLFSTMHNQWFYFYMHVRTISYAMQTLEQHTPTSGLAPTSTQQSGKCFAKLCDLKMLILLLS